MQIDLVDEIRSRILDAKSLDSGSIAELTQVYDDILQSVLMADDVSRGDNAVSVSTATELSPIVLSLKHRLDTLWAKAIIDDEESLLKLREYPYLDDSWMMVNRELILTKLTGLSLDDKSKVLIVGEDILPLTTCQLLQQTGASADVHLWGNDDGKLASDVTRVLGLATHTAFTTELPANDRNTKYNLILINSTTTDNIDGIIRKLLPNLVLSGRLVVRSARGARRLLHSVSNVYDDNLQLLIEYNPIDNTIPSSQIYRKG